MTKDFLALGKLRFYATIIIFLFNSQHAALAQDRAAKIQEGAGAGAQVQAV